MTGKRTEMARKRYLNVRARQAEQLDAYILRIKGMVGKMNGLGHDELW